LAPLAQKEFWRLKPAGFCFKKNFGGRNLPGFASKRILAAETCRVSLQKEFWRPKPAGFRFKKNFGDRKAPRGAGQV